MAIQASDVRAAYASPIDFGAQLQQIQKDKEQKQLLEEERAQRQEDRDIRRAQTLSEIEKPLYETTGTLYDDYKNSAINNFHTKDFVEYMKQNPNASYADQYRFTQSRLNGIRQNMESAKLAQRHIDQGAKYLSSNFAGIEESTLAKKLAEETFTPNGEPASSIDVNKIKDRISELELHPELMADSYDIKGGLASLIDNASKLSTDGSDVIQWKGGYKNAKYIEDVERFNTQTGKIELNTDNEKVPITKVVNGVPTTVQQDVPLLNQKAFDKLAGADLKKAMDIGLPHIHKMLEQNPEQKQLMDNMNETQLHRYLGAVFLQGANFGSDSKDVTESHLRTLRQDIRSQNAEIRAENNANKEAANTDAAKFIRMYKGDMPTLSTDASTEYYNGIKIYKTNMSGASKDGIDGVGDIGKSKTDLYVEPIIDNNGNQTGVTYYKRTSQLTNGRWFPDPVGIVPISDEEAHSLATQVYGNLQGRGKSDFPSSGGDAAQEKAAQEKAAQEKVAQEKAAQEKAAQPKPQPQPQPQPNPATTNPNTSATPTNDAATKEAMRKSLEKLHEKGNKKDDKKG